MPNLTPESEGFLAKKPKVAPTFDGVDFDDHAAYKAAQDAIIREQWVGVMKARIVRGELEKCYNKEGVNHQVNCRNWRGEFFFRAVVGWVGVGWGGWKRRRRRTGGGKRREG